MKAKRKRTKPNKQHPVHAESILVIAEKLKRHAANPQTEMVDRSTMRLIADVFEEEAKRVRKILR